MAIIKRIATGLIEDKGVDREFENIIKQIEKRLAETESYIENRLTDTKIAKTIVFYTFKSADDSAIVTNTVTLNAIGAIINWTQV